jgi:hypothetical protein
MQDFWQNRDMSKTEYLWSPRILVLDIWQIRWNNCQVTHWSSTPWTKNSIFFAKNIFVQAGDGRCKSRYQRAPDSHTCNAKISSGDFQHYVCWNKWSASVLCILEVDCPTIDLTHQSVEISTKQWYAWRLIHHITKENLERSILFWRLDISQDDDVNDFLFHNWSIIAIWYDRQGKLIQDYWLRLEIGRP